MPESASHTRPRRLGWQGFWQLHPPVALVVRASPVNCLQTLITAATPSAKRLHLRELFLDGRRYYVEPRNDGFKLTSDHRGVWGGRRSRSQIAAVVYGEFSSPNEETTFVRLRARISVLYLLSGLLIPGFIASIIVYMPWPRPVISFLVGVIFVLSLAGHRFNAAFQVNEMIYFVRKALEDLPQGEIAELPASGPDVFVNHSDFRDQWAKFYREQTQQDDR